MNKCFHCNHDIESWENVYMYQGFLTVCEECFNKRFYKKGATLYEKPWQQVFASEVERIIENDQEM